MNVSPSTCHRAAIVLAALVLAAAAVAGANHTVLLIDAPAASGSIEWDFYYSYARDAKRIVNGLAPLDEFRGPLYPLVVSLFGIALPFLTAFTVAKLISAMSVAGAVYATYLLGERAVGPGWAVAASAVTAVSSPYLLHGFLVGTDAFFACISLVAICFALKAMEGNPKSAALAGALAGLAMSTRWNAAFLPAAAVASLGLALDVPLRDRLRLIGLFAIGFGVTVAPWLALNASLHGSPFFNRNYVNLSLGIYDGGLHFNSFSEAVAHAPRYFLKRWMLNIVVYSSKVASTVLPFGVLAAVGIVVHMARGRNRSAFSAIVLFAGSLIAVNAVGPFVIRQYLVAIPLLMVAAAAAVAWLTGLARAPVYAGRILAVAWTLCGLWILADGVTAVRAVGDAEARQLTAQAMVGRKPATPLVGDWDGDGRDEVGVSRDGSGYKVFYLFRNYAEASPYWIAAYGPEKSAPFAGRWVKERADAIGVFTGGTFFLKNAVFSGVADVTSTFGDTAGSPIIGDWNGDQRDTVGTYRDGAFQLTDQGAAPFLTRLFKFGSPGDKPVAGDWNGDGVDTVGIYRDGVFTLTNLTAPPFADTWQVRMDVPGSVPLAGDWDGDGADEPGLYAADGTFYFFGRDGIMQWRIDLDRLADLPVSGE